MREEVKIWREGLVQFIIVRELLREGVGEKESKRGREGREGERGGERERQM